MSSDSLKRARITILKFLITFITIIINIGVLKAQTQDVIKVGYKSSKGFIEKEGDLYTGYLYDYLKEISIYTHWEYEMIEMDENEALEALKKGEIDLMGGLFNNEQSLALFDFPKYDMGYTYNTLVVSEDHHYDRSRYVSLDGIKVGYLETAEEDLKNFKAFCINNDIADVTLASFDSQIGEQGLIEKLKQKEIDAIIGRDLITNGMEGKIAAKFGATPYYFGTTKGNVTVIEGLNKALLRIKEQNASFEQALYHKYFEQDYLHVLILSKKQEAYLKHMEPLKVGYIVDYIPVQYYNEQKGKPDGIFVKFIERIAEKINMPFEFVALTDHKQGYELLKSGEVDIVLGILDDYLIAEKYDFILTKSIFKLDMQKVLNKQLMLQQGIDKQQKIFAIPELYKIFEESINAMNRYLGIVERDSEYTLRYYQTSKESIKAVNRGEAAITHVSNYVINHCMAQDIYDNITIYPSGEQISLAIGITPSIDENILNIFTKSIYAFNDQEIRVITDEAVSDMYIEETIGRFVKTHLEAVIIVTVLVLGIIGTLTTILVKMRIDRLKEGKRVLYEKTQIDTLTGIYNREACERLIKEYLVKKEPSLYTALMIIDVDYFKQINDRFGHRMGDQLLIEFGMLLRQLFGHNDIVSRLGGDEFVVFMTDITKENIGKVKERLTQLCQLMHKEIAYHDEVQEISLSVGAVITREFTEFNKLYAMADEMLYEVKRNGRNGFKINQIN